MFKLLLVTKIMSIKQWLETALIEWTVYWKKKEKLKNITRFYLNNGN